ncbi:unnamed protein product [Allacma fusca]|uniref:RFX-type winged-helix domain-containing protein n=1 Tax=Allacma fusca TaxID=39272 RepID=A0A8J2JXX0_9HEXA|nr:unnamed protein product [Allacma fusca]
MMEEGQPLYISMEGLCESSSQSEDEEDTPTDENQGRISRKSKLDYCPDYESDSCGEKESILHGLNDSIPEDKIVALSKKQLNRLAAMEIYPIPSGGIGTVNASLFNPVTIKWLMKNFETVDGSSLPRYLVYNHYLLHCKSLNIKPINAASFGKVIRSVFLGLQTRRLGTRGNSKYHYCGMRIKPDSPLLHVIIGDTEIRKSKSGTKGGLCWGSLNNNNGAMEKRMNWTTKTFKSWNSKFCQGLETDYMQFRFQQEENQNTMKHLKPDLDIFIPVTDGLTKDDIAIFKRYYHEHCNSLLASVVSFKLEQVGSTWQMFYKVEKNTKVIGSNEGPSTKADSSRPFTRNKLKKFVANRNVQKFINEMDKQTYTSIAYLLCPHVTVIVPIEVTQNIRNFLAIVEEWLFDALENYPEDFRTLKIKTLQNVMRPLEQTLNTNSLYCSVQKSLSNTDKVARLLASTSQINFETLNLMLGWKSETAAYSQVKEIHGILAKPNRLPLIVQWVENIVEESIATKAPTTEFKLNLQNTFLGLSFYMSFVKSELLLICRESMELFNCVENFILEYLKYFMYLRTGMQNLIASALASASCNEENIDISKTTGSNETKLNDLFASSDDDLENDRKRLIKIEPGQPKNADENVDELANDDELEALEQFLASELDNFDDLGNNIHLSIADSDLMSPDEFDENFRKYFSSAGYVTNYLCQKFVASSEEDTGTSGDEDSSKQPLDAEVCNS